MNARQLRELVIQLEASGYSVESSGEVLGKRGKPLTLHTNHKGYVYATFLSEGKMVKVYVHRLVAGKFLDNQEEKPCVNPIDGDKTNNSIGNLEWCTHSENMLHSYHTLGNSVPSFLGLSHTSEAKEKTSLKQSGELGNNARLRKEDVLHIRKKYSEGTTIAQLAENFKCSFQNIWKIVDRQTWRTV